jgi:hypothetical protein
MANNDFPHGLIPLYKIGGGPIVSNEYGKAVGTGTAIFIGDVVTRLATQFISPGGTPGTTLWLGVSLNHGAASLATTHQIVDDPFVIFECQDDGDSATLAEADMGLNANFIFGTGNAATQISAHEIDTNTANVSAALDAKLLRRHGTVNNAFASANIKLEIQFNTHQNLPNVVGL